MATYPSLTLIYTASLMAHWAVQSMVSLHTLTSISMPTPIITIPTHAVLSTLVHKARALCDHESLHDQLEFPRDTSKWNSYSKWKIWWTLDPLKTVAPPPEKLTSVALLLFAWPSISTAGCCPGITSSPWASHWGRLLSTSPASSFGNDTHKHGSLCNQYKENIENHTISIGENGRIQKPVQELQDISQEALNIT